MWTSSSCLVNSYQTSRYSVLSGLGISFQNLNLLHFDQIISLKSLSINLFLLAPLNLGLQLMRLWIQASQKALCSEREREKEGEKESCLNCVRTYLPGTVLQGCRLFKPCRNLPAGTVLEGCRLFKLCRNVSAGTVLQGCRLFKQCRNLSARHCAAGVQLFNRCRNISAGTVF